MNRLIGSCLFSSFLFLFLFTADAATLHVPGDYPTIQAAIDAASDGDTILVDPGVYEEQLLVDGKMLTIKGAGIGVTTILSPPLLDVTFTTSADNKAVVGIINGGDLTLRSVSIDGQGLGNNNYRFLGVGFRNSGGMLAYCDIRNIEDTPFSGAQHGIGIYAYNDDGTDRTITLKSCFLQDYQKGGITLNGPNVIGVVQDCIAGGVGPTPTIAQNGIQLGYGASGTVEGCTVYYHCYTGGTWTSCGILLYDGAWVDVRNCPGVVDNQTGVYFVTTSGTFGNNTVKAGINAQGGDGAYWGLGIDDLGPRGRPPSAFGDGERSSGRLNTSVYVYQSTFTADQTGDGTGIGCWAQSTDSIKVKIVDCDVTKWRWGIEVWSDGTAVPHVNVYQCSLADNLDYGVVNYTDTNVNATYNWWGDATGPYHPTGNPGGLGDGVSDYVTFDPWLTGAEPLQADTFVLEPYQGGTVNLSLDAGTTNAFRNYLVLGSISGTDPGTPLPGGQATLPLNWDLFTSLMIPFLNTSTFYNFLGVLDFQGKGSAVLNAPPLLFAPLAGQKLYFAYALNAPWDFASNPIRIYLLP